MTKHPASPLARLAAAILPQPQPQPAPQPEPEEQPEGEQDQEPTVKMYRFISYGD